MLFNIQNQMDEEAGFIKDKLRNRVIPKTDVDPSLKENTEDVFKRAEMREVDEGFSTLCCDRLNKK